MKELTIVSGKGGTGKTTVCASLGRLWENKVMVDCDVDAANLNLLFNSQVVKETPFYSGYKASIYLDACISCGKCTKACRFDAITDDYMVSHLDCIGCGACKLVCPENAITLTTNRAGTWYHSATKFGQLVHAALGIAEDNSGKLVSQIRSYAKELAKNTQELILIDGPPGIGCPVIAAVTNVDLVLIVTEPSLSGLHDLQRLVKVVEGFDIPWVVCINKFDLNSEITKLIYGFCHEHHADVVGMIPFDRRIVDSSCTVKEEEQHFFDKLPTSIQESIRLMFTNLSVHLQ